MGIKKTVEEMVEGLTLEMRQGFKAMDSKFDGKIDVLTVEMREGFETVNERFESVDNRIGFLAVEMREGFRTIDKKIDDKIEWLAVAVQNGFEDITKEFRTDIGEVKERLDKIEFTSGNIDPRVSVLEHKMQIVGAKLGLQS